MASSSARRPSGLTHPLWWLALLILVLNDHWLKGAGVLPGWLTGKLSDFAGLVVAPVLAVALLRARSRGAKLGSFALVSVLFSAPNLSPAMAEGMEQVVGWMGVPWTIWSDPTDLIALAVIPLAWRLVHLPPRSTPDTISALERAGLAMGSMACIATSAAPGPYTTDAYLVNRTEKLIDVRIRWVDARLSCEDLVGRASEVLDRSLFGEGITFELGPGRTVPLERGAAARAASGPTASEIAAPDCEAAMISADGLSDTLVYWEGLSMQSVPPSKFNDDLPEMGRVSLRGEGGLHLIGSDDLDVAPFGLREEPSVDFCEGDRPLAYGYSTSGPIGGGHVVVELYAGPDGCSQLVLQPAGGEGAGAGASDGLEPPEAQLFLCVPEWARPFSVGDEILIDQVESDHEGRTLPPALWIDRLRDDRTVAETVLVEAFRGEPLLLVDLPRTEPVDGGCMRELPCGARVEAQSLAIGEGLAPVRPGGDLAFVGTDGKRRRIAVGRLERTIVAREMCGDGGADLGVEGDVVMWIDGEEGR